MTTFARVPLSRPSCAQMRHVTADLRHAKCTLCLLPALQTHREALCQLLHVGYNIRMCALTHGNAVQARAGEEVRIIHLGDLERSLSVSYRGTQAYTGAGQRQAYLSQEECLMNECFDELRYHGNIRSCIR